LSQAGRRYLFTGGGTGGHVTPNIALIGEIRRRENDAQFLYLGSKRGYEAKVRELGVRLVHIPCAQSVSPRRPIRFLWMLAVVLAGTLKSAFVILWFRPSVVIATGGFVSVPSVLGAALTRRRIFLQEQNARLGAANRFLAQFAGRVGLTFQRSLRECPEPRGVFVGYPVRSKIQTGSADAARARFGIPEGQRVVFVVGGSMGSRSINRGMVEALKTLLKDPKVSVIHSTGLAATHDYHAFDDTCERLRQLGLNADIPGRYACRRFIDDIQDVYALADLVVARSGAGTIMELGAIGKASLLVPKSDAPGGHQLENALAFADAGAAEIFYEEPSYEEGRMISRVYGDQLGLRLLELLEHEDSLLAMGRQAHRMVIPDALSRNLEEIHGLADGKPRLNLANVKVQTGVLLDRNGVSTELRFQSNLVSSGALADVRLERSTSVTRAFIRERRDGSRTEFFVVPRKGRVEVNGAEAVKPTKISSEDRVTIGADRFTFQVIEREIPREQRALAVPRKVFATGVGTLVSRLFGLARDVVTAATFSLGRTLDLFAVGLRISNFFRAVFAETAVDSAFLPTFVQLFRSGRKEEANRLFATVLKLTIVGTVVTTVVAIVTLPMWIEAVTPGFGAKGMLDEAITVTRIMFPYLILISVAALLAAVLKAFNRYGLPANASIMFNLGIMAGVALYPVFGIAALGYGVLAGGVGQVLIQLPPLFGSEIRRGHGFRFGSSGLDLGNPGLKRVGRVTPNILADTTITKAGEVVDVTIASLLAEGAIGALNLGRTIFLLPFGLIAQTVNTVLLKELSESMATQDAKYARKLMIGGINWTIFLLLPVSAAMVILADPIVRALLQYGRFGADQVPLVALAVQCYAVGLVGWGLVALTGRFFAARGQMGLGTLTNLLALVTSVSLSLALVKTPFGFAGIALSSGITFTLAAILRLALLNSSLREEEAAIRWADVWPTVFHTTLATSTAAIAAAMSLAAVRKFEAFPGLFGVILNRGFQLGIPLFFGGFAFAGTAFLLECEQMDEILARLQRGRGRGPAPEPKPARESHPVVPQWLPSGALLRWVTANGAAAAHCNLNKRVAQLLDRPRWQERNVGAKLVGMLKMRSHRARLCTMVTSREPAPLRYRFLGADLREPGFVRRNAVEALGILGDPDEKTEQAFLTALRDSYWEVRTAAAGALGDLAPLVSEETRAAALKALADLATGRCFETAAASVRALGALARDESVLATFRRLHYHPNWQVRDAVVCAYEEMHRRGVVADGAKLKQLLDDVLVTCDSFRPFFQLKENLVRVRAKFEGAATARESA
jgi:putative peptidoglycan lipid II flippase